MKFNTILIQGAMDIEVEYLKEELKINESKIIAGYEFYVGNINNTQVIVS